MKKSHYVTHSQGRKGRSLRPLPPLVVQLKNRVRLGQDPEAVLDDLSIRRPGLRSAYLARLADSPT